MADYDIEDLCRELDEEIASAPICEPVGDEFVDECAWSRTGFAIWKPDGPSSYCTCRPSQPPAYRGDGAQ